MDTVDYFNNMKIYPRLQSLLVRDYFRFYNVNLKRECPFWADDSKCAMRYCHVKPCQDVSCEHVHGTNCMLYAKLVCNLVL